MIQGERVTLRAITPADYPRLTEFKNDVEFELLGGGLPPKPRTLAGVTEFYEKVTGPGDQYTFAIEADGVLIGDVGLFNINRVNGTGELGIGIGDPAYRGQGYGREAVGLVLGYGFRLQNLRKIWLEVHGSNERAIRSYTAAGFVEEGRQRAHVWSDGGYDDVVLMAVFRE